MNRSTVLIAFSSMVFGLVAGFFVDDIMSTGDGAEKKSDSPRALFLSGNDEDEFDYERIARVCLAVGSNQPVQRQGQVRSPIASMTKPEVQEVKTYLDQLVEKSVDQGTWTRRVSVRARSMLQKLPVEDAANFEELLRTTLESGQLSAQPGAWVPESIN